MLTFISKDFIKIEIEFSSIFLLSVGAVKGLSKILFIFDIFL